MTNPHVLHRLETIQKILNACHSGGAGLSLSIIGSERESFINLVLSNVIAPPWRTGTGQITDHEGTLCAQADIVIEYSNSLSFPLLQGNQARLYLAESVCCVVEVKSDVEGKWDEVVAAAEKLSQLRRKVGAIPGMTPPPPDIIPMFAVGYCGWKTERTCRDKLNKAFARAPGLSGLLVLEPPGIYIGGKDYGEHSMTGPQSIFGFLLSVEQLTSSFIAAKPRLIPYVE